MPKKKVLTAAAFKTLADVATIFPGAAVYRRPTAGKRIQSVPVITVRDLADGVVMPTDCLATAPIQAAKAAARYRVEERDILLACRGTQFKVAHVGSHSAGAIVTSNLLVVRPGPEVLSPLLFAYLASNETRSKLMRDARSATGQLAFTAQDVGNLKIVLPPLSEQQRIADLLEATEKCYQQAVRAAELRRLLGHELALRMFSGGSDEGESDGR